MHHLLAVFPQRLEDYPLDPRADLVVASNQWSHMPRSHRVSFVARVHDALRPGGFFVMNCPQDTPLRMDQPWDEIHRRVFGELVLRHFASSTSEADGRDRRVRFEYRVEHHGQTVHTVAEEYTLFLTNPEEARTILLEAGFGAIRLRAGYSDADYEASAPGFVVVAQRPPIG